MGYVNQAIWNDYMYLKQVYPELFMSCLELNLREAVGTVILPELRSEPREVRARLSFPIRVVYTDKFPDEEIMVFDAENRIKWDLIPREHQHSRGKFGLCTHHHDALESVRNKDNRSILIVRSAILLYLSYLQYAKTGKWPEKFEDLPHDGTAALRIVRRDSKKR